MANAKTKADPVEIPESEAESAVEEQTPEPTEEPTAIAEAMNKAVQAKEELAPVEKDPKIANLPLVRKCAEADFYLTEEIQSMYTIHPPVGTQPEDVMQPIFWAHVAKRLRPMAEIRVMPKDGTWYGVFLVIYADDHSATVKELSLTPVDVSEAGDNEVYFVKWISPPLKWGVVRKADNARIKDGFDDQKSATVWMHGYKKSHG